MDSVTGDEQEECHGHSCNELKSSALGETLGYHLAL